MRVSSMHARGTSGSDDRVDVGMLLQRVHALFLVQVEADALLYHMVNLNQQHKLSNQNHPFVEMVQGSV